jgi:Fungal specific transcription factor domain
MPELVDRDWPIEAMLLEHPQPPPPPGGIYYPAGGGGSANNPEAKRHLIANIFHTTVQVYLHSVLLGENLGCLNIHNVVRKTINSLWCVPAEQSNGVVCSILWSVVFGMCLYSCLMDDNEEQDFLLKHLDEEQAQDMGNCTLVRSVMQLVWEQRRNSFNSALLSWCDATQIFGDIACMIVMDRWQTELGAMSPNASPLAAVPPILQVHGSFKNLFHIVKSSLFCLCVLNTVDLEHWRQDRQKPFVMGRWEAGKENPEHDYDWFSCWLDKGSQKKTCNLAQPPLVLLLHPPPPFETGQVRTKHQKY